MRKRFEARKGSKRIIFWAEDWHEALADFESAFTGADPSEESAHRAAAYDVVEASPVPDTVRDFLKGAAKKGGRPRNAQPENNTRFTGKAPRGKRKHQRGHSEAITEVIL